MSQILQNKTPDERSTWKADGISLPKRRQFADGRSDLGQVQNHSFPRDEPEVNALTNFDSVQFQWRLTFNIF